MKHDEFLQLEQLNKHYAQLEEKEEQEVEIVSNNRSIYNGYS